MCYGLFEWSVVLFALTNAPGVFICIMNWLFEDFLDQGVVIFLDNILIYSTMVKQHLNLLKKVFLRLQQYYYYCKLKKCLFLQPTISFLGF